MLRKNLALLNIRKLYSFNSKNRNLFFINKAGYISYNIHNLKIFNNIIKRTFSVKKESNKDKVKEKEENWIKHFFKKENFTKDNIIKHIRDFGGLFLFIYLCLYIPSFLTFLYLFSRRKLEPEKVADLLIKYDGESYMDVKMLKELSQSDNAALALAMICARMTIVIRAPLTLFLTILLRRFFI